MQELTRLEVDSRLSFIVDPEAEPVDWDWALAGFLLRFVRSTPSGSISPEKSDSNSEVE